MAGNSLRPEFWLSLGSVVASTSFLLLLPFRIWKVRKAPTKIRPSWYDALKLALTVLYVAWELASLVVLILASGPQTWSKSHCLAAMLSAIGSFGITWLSRLEHRRSEGPSDSIVLYLLVLLLLNAVRVSLPSVRQDLALRGNVVYHLDVLQILLVLLLLVAEGWSKDCLLREEYRSLPPERSAGLVGRLIFSWINPILAEGYHGLLKDHRLPELDEELASKQLREKALREWDHRSTSLPFALFRALSRPFLFVIGPRLCLIAFRYSQPVLMERVIRSITHSGQFATEDDEGCSLIWAAVIVYVGLAISSAAYQHGLNRLQTSLRGALIGLIHGKMLESRSRVYDDGKAIGLATAEVGALETIAEMFHETWAQFLEVVIGVLLLARQVGWLWPVPLIMIFVSSQTSRHVAKNLRERQANWNKATQKRMAATSAMLSSVKNIKTLGMEESLEQHVQKLREQELNTAQKMRWLMNVYNASANALGILAPVITVILFAILAMAQGRALDTATAFPTIAILVLVTHPANMVMTYVPRAVAAYASFERIEEFLRAANRPARADPTRYHDNYDGHATVVVEKLCFASEGVGHRILDHISFELHKGSIVACSGPVGAGKTVLARLILGELTPSSGTVFVSSRATSFCSQAPWLPNKTIRDVIVGYELQKTVGDRWYTTVVQACCLQHDFFELPAGDSTLVGDRGQNLSGGQRQRVVSLRAPRALARALYQRHEVAILDDTLSALDGLTDKAISENLFGREGLFRRHGTTVFWITNSEQHFPLADRVLVLDGTIRQLAPRSELRTDNEQILKLVRHEKENEDYQRLSRSGSTPLTQPPAKTDASDDLKRCSGDATLYAYYFRAAGAANVALLTTCSACYSFFITFPQFWLKWWTEDAGENTTIYIVVYALLSVFAWTFTVSAMWLAALRIAPKSGLELHRRLLQVIMGAPLLFFSTTDTGVILNRFGQDLDMVDKQLSNAVLMLSTQTWKMVAQVFALLVVQYRLSLTLPFCAFVVYVVQKIYLRTSRQLRYRELESRAGVYTSLLETTQGLETIRAFGWQQAVAEENISALDASQRPFYLLFCLQRWLNIVLDLIVAFIAVAIIALAVVLRGTTTGGQIGVALNLMLVANTTLLKLVQSWTNLEISLGAVSRLRSAERDTPREDMPGEDFVPDAQWPSAGSLQLRDIGATYGQGNVAFEHINLSVSPGQTAVICGRTGSGKSSLFLALLRILDIKQGNMTVDSVDLCRVPRHVIRQRCFVTVSQDSFVLVPGASLLFNLSPSGSSKGTNLIEALRTVGLWYHFTNHKSHQPSRDQNGQIVLECDCDNLETNGICILNEPISSLPMLSGGQVQLLAIARALVRIRDTRPGTAIVLLDEITSSLDPVAEALVCDVVQREFVDAGHTVIMVTHKLGAFAKRMREGDVVVWMAEGRVEKIQTPAEISHSS